MASLIHDDVLDDADTRRGIGSLNFVVGNKVTIHLFYNFLVCTSHWLIPGLKIVPDLWKHWNEISYGTVHK